MQEHTYQIIIHANALDVCLDFMYKFRIKEL